MLTYIRILFCKGVLIDSRSLIAPYAKLIPIQPGPNADMLIPVFPNFLYFIRPLVFLIIFKSPYITANTKLILKRASMIIKFKQKVILFKQLLSE